MTSCEFCDDDDGHVHLQNVGKQSFYLCRDHRRQVEEHFHYDMTLEVDRCPTCHHLHGARLRYYTKDDPEAQRCDGCGKFFHHDFIQELRHLQLCEKCKLEKEEELEAKGELDPETCPGCGRELAVREVLRPGRVPLIIKICWYCGTEATMANKEAGRSYTAMPPIGVGAIF